jgi:predicted enzyme related to lactoylglutathione lyase
MEALMINKIDVTVFSVKDFAKAVKFYSGTLGLKTEMEIPDFYHEFNIGNTWLGLYKNSEGKSGGTACVFLNVDKIEPEMERLKAKGVEFHGKIEDTPGCRMAFFGDPEGNELCLHELKPGHG